MGVQVKDELRKLLVEFSREKENLLALVEEQRQRIGSLLLRVKKLEEATRCSGSKIEGKPSIDGDGERKKDEAKRRVKARIDYGDKVCYHCHTKGHIQFTCKKLREDLRKLKLLEAMEKNELKKKPIKLIGGEEKRR